MHRNIYIYIYTLKSASLNVYILLGSIRV